MTLGPSGAAMLHQRKRKEETTHQQPSLKASAFVAPDRGSADRMQSFFNAAMDRVIREQQTPEAAPAAQFTGPVRTSADTSCAPRAAATAKVQGTQDVEMESVGSRHSELADEYDPDDTSLEAPRSAAVASAGATSGNTSTPQRIQVSAISELKYFSGKGDDVDRARSWIGKAKSAFLRDQAPDSEKCLVFGNLMSGPARKWYRQLARSIRSDWKSLLESFLVQYCERGVSVARQYYHAQKRSDESPNEYLHRLNAAGMRAKLPIKGGTTSTRREHVEHFIETLDDRDLADQLVLLRLRDADELEETLRLRQRSKARQGRAAVGSNRFRQRAAPAANSASAKPARVVQAIQAADGSSSSESDDSGLDQDAGYRRIHINVSIVIEACRRNNVPIVVPQDMTTSAAGNG
ncbi:unnamed protein product [Phytophthora fragariaefolia]|uniref:Unnamed protein product n=1 Tax=Phytophthora fragariaefolia TaxID=1490495 RepID=A0A9W7DA77_9STRA|nr:unnamed protein product [Phytophthora fragariaefolia]